MAVGNAFGLHESSVYTWAMMLPEPYQICYLGQSLKPDFNFLTAPGITY